MGGMFGGNGDDDAAQEERAELAKEKADRVAKAKELMLKRLQMLKRRGGGAGVGGNVAPDQQDQQDLLGG